MESQLSAQIAGQVRERERVLGKDSCGVGPWSLQKRLDSVKRVSPKGLKGLCARGQLFSLKPGGKWCLDVGQRNLDVLWMLSWAGGHWTDFLCRAPRT